MKKVVTFLLFLECIAINAYGYYVENAEDLTVYVYTGYGPPWTNTSYIGKMSGYHDYVTIPNESYFPITVSFCADLVSHPECGSLSQNDTIERPGNYFIWESIWGNLYSTDLAYSTVRPKAPLKKAKPKKP